MLLALDRGLPSSSVDRLTAAGGSVPAMVPPPAEPHCVAMRCAAPPNGRFQAGFTLLELVAVMTLLALGVAHLLPQARRWGDRVAVRAAREEVVGLLHRARMEAVAWGGATVVITSAPPEVELWVTGRSVAISSLRDQGVALTLSGDRPRVELVYDALGLGRVASQTLRFRRGSAEALLVVSAWGRVRRP